MSSIFHTDLADRNDGLQSHLFFGAMYPLCIAAEGLSRFFARLASDDDEAEKAPRSLFAQARANASIATSYALMARTMLHSSDRKYRSERLS
jgi:hypothetical protein